MSYAITSMHMLSLISVNIILVLEILTLEVWWSGRCVNINNRRSCWFRKISNFCKTLQLDKKYTIFLNGWGIFKTYYKKKYNPCKFRDLTHLLQWVLLILRLTILALHFPNFIFGMSKRPRALFSFIVSTLSFLRNFENFQSHDIKKLQKAVAMWANELPQDK